MVLQQLPRTVRVYAQTSTSLLCRAVFQREYSKIKANKMLVAVGQMRATNDKKDNLQKVTHLLEKAKKENAKFLFLPECCDFVGENRQETIALSEPLNGPTVAAYMDLAKKNDMWLSLGGIHEAILDSEGEKTDKIYNAHVVIDDKGNVVKVYHKLHLFDVTTPEFRFRESDVVSGGDQIVPPLNTPFGNLGLLICYDVRFPDVATQLRKLGAEILTYPAAFAFSTGKAHWEILLRARAIENQCYVIAAAQIGFHNAKRQSYGHALIVDPWGKILATTDEKELDIATATIDLTKMETIRKNIPCYGHRRSDVYNLTAIDGIDLEGVDRRFGPQTIRKETIFFESPYCYAFTNLRCVVKGHVLVSTKRWAARLHDLNGDEVTDLFRTVCKIERMLEDIYKTSSSTVTVQDGPDAGQTVEHVHFHVMPRRPGDFGHNDQIYVQLEKFSKEIRDRTVEERIEEAEFYRRYLAKELPALP